MSSEFISQLGDRPHLVGVRTKQCPSVSSSLLSTILSAAHHGAERGSCDVRPVSMPAFQNSLFCGDCQLAFCIQILGIPLLNCEAVQFGLTVVSVQLDLGKMNAHHLRRHGPGLRVLIGINAAPKTGTALATLLGCCFSRTFYMEPFNTSGVNGGPREGD